MVDKVNKQSNMVDKVIKQSTISGVKTISIYVTFNSA